MQNVFYFEITFCGVVERFQRSILRVKRSRGCARSAAPAKLCQHTQDVQNLSPGETGFRNPSGGIGKVFVSGKRAKCRPQETSSDTRGRGANYGNLKQ